MSDERSGDSIEGMTVFEEGCAKSRVNELVERFAFEMAHEEKRELARAERLKGEIPPSYPYSNEIMQRFGEKARTKALEILEKERFACIEYRTPYLTMVLKDVRRRLRSLVFDSNGKKHKIFFEKVPVEGSVAIDNPSMRDVRFVGDHDFERLNQIEFLKVRFSEFEQYARYMNPELLSLYREVVDLSTFEMGTEEELKKVVEKTTEETASTEETHKQGA